VEQDSEWGSYREIEVSPSHLAYTAYEALTVGGQDDKLRDTTVQGLSGLVGTLLQLPVVSGLLHKIEDPTQNLSVFHTQFCNIASCATLLHKGIWSCLLLRESLIGLGPCGGVVFGHCDIEFVRFEV